MKKINRETREKIKQFLRVNLETFEGKELNNFIEKYEIKEANKIQMMMIDQGISPDAFLSFSNGKGSFYIVSYEFMEKMLVLEPDTIKEVK